MAFKREEEIKCMRLKSKLDLTNHKILKDKNIKPETKEIYCYLYIEGFDRNITNINIGRVQTEFRSIRNLAFRKNLQQLEKYNYIKFTEYRIN